MKHKFETHFFCPDLPKSGEGTLSAEESRHLLKVFRLRVGNSVLLTDGKGRLIEAKILDDNLRGCHFVIQKRTEKQCIPKVSLAVGYLRDKDMEHLVDCCTQLPLKSITLLKSRHSSEIRGKNPNRLLDRLRLKSLVGLKQAKKTWLTEICDPMNLQDWREQTQGSLLLLDADGSEELPQIPEGPLHVLVGPEGGFSAEEVQDFRDSDALTLSLGKTRLRGRDAAFFALGKISKFLS